MSRLKLVGFAAALGACVWTVACDSDEPERNPSFTVAEAGQSSGGVPAEDGGQPNQPSPAGRGGGSSNAGTSNAGSPPEAMAGAAGAGPEQPPYDCVLHPTTHLEIINACTDAVRIEKHPSLPALPR